MMLDQLVTTAPDFRAAVNVIEECDDFAQADAFVPTDAAAKAIFDLGRQLEPNARQRARLITGPYGTGKSHLALVLAAVYRGRSDLLQTLFRRLKEKYPGQAETFDDQIARAKLPYLVVLIEGDQDDFDLALVRGLMGALRDAGLGDYTPRTAFAAAADRLAELMEDPEARPRLEQEARRLGGLPPGDLLKALRGETADNQMVEAFRELHRRVCFGADFSLETRMSAVSTYKEAVEKLIAEDRAGAIVVLWDEFGAFMERVVSNPAAVGGPVQRFAEACQDSRDKPLHLYLVAHRSLASYVARARDTLHLTQSQQTAWGEELSKIQGRFTEFLMDSKTEELFDLLVDAILIQNTDNGWRQFAAENYRDFELLTNQAHHAALFPDLPYAKLRRSVVEGCYPLAPATSAILPRVCTVVAQNQRTLFTFLCGNHPGTVAEFLRTTPVPQPGEPLPLIPADAVWDYFENAIRQDSVAGRIHAKYRQATATAAVTRSPDLGLRLVKAVALLEVARLGSALEGAAPPTTARILELALGLRTQESRQAMLQALDDLSRPGPDRALARDRDVYRLAAAGGGVDLEELVAQTIDERRNAFRPADFIRQRWSGNPGASFHVQLGFADKLEDLRAAEDVARRTVHIVPALPEALDRLEDFTGNIGKGEFWDGLLLMVLSTDDGHTDVINRVAQSSAQNHQVLIAYPSSPLRNLRELIARVDALEYIVGHEPAVWGRNGERRDEFADVYDSAARDLRDLLACVDPRGNRIDVICISSGTEGRCTRTDDLCEAAQKAMARAFYNAPRCNDEIMGWLLPRRDGTRAARHALIDKLIERNAASLLRSETDNAQKRFVRLLEAIGYYDAHRTPPFAVPRRDEHPGAAAVWDAIRSCAERATSNAHGVMLRELVTELRCAPYGIGLRAIPVLMACVLRDDFRSGNLRLQRLARGGWRDVDLQGAALDDAVQQADSHRLCYIEVTDEQLAALQGLVEALGGPNAVPEDGARLLPAAQENIRQWLGELPAYCKQTQHVSDQAKWLRDVLMAPVASFDAAPQLLISTLATKLAGGGDRKRYAEQFRQWMDEIEQATAKLPELLAAEVGTVWGLPDGTSPQDTARAIRDWYHNLDEPRRNYCFIGDAGKLQSWARSAEPGDLTTLAESVLGRLAADLTDRSPGHLAGRLASAKESIESWVPRPESPLLPEPTPVSRTATLRLYADLGGRVVSITREFRVIPTDELSEQGKLILRLLETNLKDNPALHDGERESIILALIRSVFGDA